jgi:hypothetical protein
MRFHQFLVETIHHPVPETMKKVRNEASLRIIQRDEATQSRKTTS